MSTFAAFALCLLLLYFFPIASFLGLGFYKQLTMSSSYADAVRSRGERRQSPPNCNAYAHLPEQTGALPPATSEQSQSPQAADMELESQTSSLSSQVQKLSLNINPTKPRDGESLPTGYARNYAGFLVKTQIKRIHVPEELVAAEERYLQDHLIVASFIGGRPSPSGFNSWLSKLNAGIRGGSISFCGDLGWGFSCLKASNQEAASQALILTPSRIDSFLCVFQQWTPQFDPASSRGMLIPTWITLKKLPLQFFGVAQDIAATLEKVLGKDANNCYFKDPRFCIALDTSRGWETELEIEDCHTGKLIAVLIDYANLPIRCRYCHDLNHQISACPQRPGRMRQAKQDSKNNTSKMTTQPSYVAPPQPNAPIADKDGFTLVDRPRRPGMQRGPPEFQPEDPRVALDSSPRRTIAPPNPTEDQPILSVDPTSNDLHEPCNMPRGNIVLPDVAPAQNLSNQLSTALRKNNTASGNSSQPSFSPEALPASPIVGQLLPFQPQPRASVSDPLTLLTIPTQRLTDPTQPFLALHLDLNVIVEKEPYTNPELGGVSDSTPTNAIRRSRSRSRSRSPSRGRANSTSLTRNFSSEHICRTLRACPGTGSHQLI